MRKRQLLEWQHYTPKKGKKMVSIMRYGEWLMVYQKEVILAHTSHEDMLLAAGLERCNGVKVYRTKKAALQGKNNYYIHPTE